MKGTPTRQWDICQCEKCRMALVPPAVCDLDDYLVTDHQKCVQCGILFGPMHLYREYQSGRDVECINTNRLREERGIRISREMVTA